MSDYQSQDPGATQVLPTAPPAAPPAAPAGPPGAPTASPPPNRGLPWWAVLIIALLVLLLGVGGTWAVLTFAGGRPDTELADRLTEENEALKKDVADLSSKVASLSAGGGTTTGQQSGGSESENNPPAGGTTGTADDGKQFAYVRSFGHEGATLKLTVDYAQFLTGAQAAAAAAAHGDESPPPNDYYIVNDNPKLRTFPVQAGISVRVYNWGGTDASAPSMVTLAQWVDVLPGGAHTRPEIAEAPYWITIQNGVIVKIEQQYLP